jgi:hypothetical protein
MGTFGSKSKLNHRNVDEFFHEYEREDTRRLAL